jgi:hypothetical protein
VEHFFITPYIFLAAELDLEPCAQDNILLRHLIRRAGLLYNALYIFYCAFTVHGVQNKRIHPDAVLLHGRLITLAGRSL